MTFTEAFRLYGPDTEKLAEVLRISPPDTDKLKNYMMDNKPLCLLERKKLNEKCRRLTARHALRAIREKHEVAA